MSHSALRLTLIATAIIAVVAFIVALMWIPTASAHHKPDHVPGVCAKIAGHHLCVSTSPSPSPEPSPTESPTTEPSPSPSDEPTTEPSPSPSPTNEPSPSPSPTETTSGFPDASTTGVPEGTTLTPSGSIVVTEPDTVIDGLHVTGKIELRDGAHRTVIRNTRIEGGWRAIEMRWDWKASALIEDVDIVGNGTRDEAVHCHDCVLRRVDISGYEDGPRMLDRFEMYFSYVHDLDGGGVDDPHYDALQSTGGHGIRIVGNTLLNHHGQTSAILLKPDFDPLNDVLVEGNLMAGGGWTFYGGDFDGMTDPLNIVVRGNHFSTRYFPESGYYGVACCFGPESDGNVWEGNVWHETGEPVPRP